MLETNIRLVKFGANLQLNARIAEVVTQEASADLLERACNALLRRHGLAAIRFGDKHLLVVSRGEVPQETVEQENWRLEIRNTGESRRLSFRNRDDQNRLAQFLERGLIAQISRRTSLWKLDSNRIWYQPKPFDTVDDVAAYRRYEIASIVIDGVGVGLIVDIGTAFFTIPTVADYFREDISTEEKIRLRRRFERLSARQQEQKGTLLYDLGNGWRSKCYFDSFWGDVTAKTTPALRLDGINYDSLQDYYKRKHGISVTGDEPVARVSFRGIDRPVPVAASKLRVRVANDSLPRRLKNVDKIGPDSRRDMIEEFWQRMGEPPLGDALPSVEKSLWRPPRERIIHLKPPDLVFGKGEILQAPLDGRLSEYRSYYRDRVPLLDKVGCFHVPPTIPRVLHVAVPESFGSAIAEYLADAVAERLTHWTRIEIAPEWFLYDTTEQAIARLRQEPRAGAVLFVFNQDDPATYFNLSHELQDWRIKRITQATLSDYAVEFGFAADASNSGRASVVRRPERWDSFIEENALDVLQQIDCVPFAFANPAHYEARLAIDVGKDRSHFSLSLLICRPQSTKPFRLSTRTPVKADRKKETINEIHLQDEIIKLGEQAIRAGFCGIDSILVARDGRECGNEIDGIDDGCDGLRNMGLLSKDARVDIIDFHKNTVKRIRLWDCGPEEKARHAIEGNGILINDHTVVFVNTGAATLHQGTATPVMIEARTQGMDIVAAATDEHASSQLNYSNPRVAQRLPLELKRTDDELRNRAAQEIRRIK